MSLRARGKLYITARKAIEGIYKDILDKATKTTYNDIWDKVAIAIQKASIL
jgi:hypothetical protein